MKKHVTNEHGPNLVKCIVHKTSLEGRDSSKRQKRKSRAFIMPTSIIIFFGGVKFYKKSNPIQMGFIKDLVFMIVKGCIPLSIMESPWLKQMVLCLYGEV
jgi:hypothetical protein